LSSTLFAVFHPSLRIHTYPIHTFLISDVIKGRFDTKVICIECKNNVNDIANILHDYSADTINEMIDDGYRDGLREIARQ
jgi:hypothetical protein